MIRALKTKRCKVCGHDFTPISSMSKVCSVPCSLEWARKLAEKKAAQDARTARRTAREDRERVKTRGEHLRDAQATFNAYVRTRDFGLPCISCGLAPKQVFGGAVDCGHYRSVGSAPQHRFNLKNCAAQCVKCNRFLGSNSVEMRKGLIAKIGIEAVEALESDQSVRKFDVEYLKRLKRIFREKARRTQKLQDRGMRSDRNVHRAASLPEALLPVHEEWLLPSFAKAKDDSPSGF
jgi:hypothetical protein